MISARQNVPMLTAHWEDLVLAMFTGGGRGLSLQRLGYSTPRWYVRFHLMSPAHNTTCLATPGQPRVVAWSQLGLQTITVGVVER